MTMLKDLWSVLWKAILIAGIVVSFFFLAELLRIFMLLYRINAIFGLAFAALIALLTIVLLARWWIAQRRSPSVLAPPPIGDPDLATHKEMLAYCRYLTRYMDRLAMNSALDEADRTAAAEQADGIRSLLRAHPLNDDLRMTIRKSEEELIRPLLNKLNDHAAREVRKCVRDVMIGVTLSPYPSVDLLIVMYRNLAMVSRVISVYRSRPALREQLMILRDILVVVATVNFINLNRKLLDNLFSQIPMVGRFIDDIGQGVGAGILTSVAGHAAMDRCAAFKGWNSQEEIASIAARSAQFLADVRQLFTRDLLPEMKGRIRADVPQDKVEEPGFWESIERGVLAAMDLTGKAWDSFVLKPAVAGMQGVAVAGSALARGVARGGSSVARVSARHTRSAFRGFQTLTERIRYTFIGRWTHRR